MGRYGQVDEAQPVRHLHDDRLGLALRQRAPCRRSRSASEPPLQYGITDTNVERSISKAANLHERWGEVGRDGEIWSGRSRRRRTCTRDGEAWGERGRYGAVDLEGGERLDDAPVRQRGGDVDLALDVAHKRLLRRRGRAG